LKSAESSALRDTALRGFDLAWQGRRITPAENLRRAFEETWNADTNHSPLIQRVGLRMNFPPAVLSALTRLTDARIPETERAELATVAGECAIAAARPALLALLNTKPRLELAAISALQNFEDTDIAAALISNYARFNTEARTRARTALASRAAWSRELVQAVLAGKFDAKEITPDTLRQMIRHNDAQLTAAIEKRWGKLQAQSSADKVSAVNRLKLVLNPSGTTLRFKGDAAEGKKLFTQACASCHKLFGEGNTIGPELTGADRKNAEWLLTQIVDPSAFIRPEYVNHNVEMKDGRSLSGLLVEQTDSAVTLLEAQNQRTVLNRAEVKEINASSTSLMPEALLDPLTPQQLRDLFAYLQSAQ
jgi:putative heme-binding domain-containing protein